MALILLSYIVQIPIPYLIKEYLDWIADGDSG
jgi:ABC-type multidrug transport system fused ATPase/permease subunit